MDPGLAWLQTFLLTIVFAVVLTTIATPLLLMLYRRWVTAGMREGGDAKASIDRGANGVGPAATSAPVVLQEVDLKGLAASSPSKTALQTLIRKKRWRLILAYAVSGIVIAAMLTIFFAISHWQVIGPTVTLVVFALFALPIAPTVLYLASASRRHWLIGTVVVAVVLFLLIGAARDLGVVIFQLHLLMPLLLFAVFSLRFWRGAASMTLLVFLVASFGWVAAFVIANKFLGITGPVLWACRFAGFAAGLALGYQALAWLSRRHAEKAFSDQQLFLDAWWLLFILIQAIVFTATREDPLFLGVVLSFAVFLGIKAAMIRPAVRLDAGRRPPRLLLLRVFGFDKRAEALFEGLGLQWRLAGSIDLIAGRDLALRNVGPTDFLAFLSGRLRRQFVQSEEDLAARLQTLDDKPDPDGRFRVNPFLCRDDTWRPTMRALAERADVILMDLRGFIADRAGCSYELQHLARQAPRKPVIFIADETTSLETVRDLLGAETTVALPRSNTPHGDQGNADTWTVVHVASASGDPGARLFDLLAARAASPQETINC